MNASAISMTMVCLAMTLFSFASNVNAQTFFRDDFSDGDANQDLEFNQIDLVQVQIAAKYLTGQPATWGEGDFDGAPGGQPGSPPPGDGFFDRLDVIAALNASGYLTGPYAGDGSISKACEGLAISANDGTDDNFTSIVYDPTTGEVAVAVVEPKELTSININSATGIFDGNRADNLGGSFDNDADDNIFKATIGSSFGLLSFGNVAQPGLTYQFVLDDLSVLGSLAGGGGLGNVVLEYGGGPILHAGDADQDLDVDQRDLVQALQAAKYLTGLPATWGEGDWNGAPGGHPGNPPPGDGLFDQLDIIAVLNNSYLTGPYAAIRPGGQDHDEHASIGYDSRTGEVWVEPPVRQEFTSVNIASESGIFTRYVCPFDCNDSSRNIFKATFGGSFGRHSFGPVADVGLTEEFLVDDLSVIRSLSGGGELETIELVYVPEPSSLILASVAVLGIAAIVRRYLGRPDVVSKNSR